MCTSPATQSHRCLDLPHSWLHLQVTSALTGKAEHIAEGWEELQAAGAGSLLRGLHALTRLLSELHLLHQALNATSTWKLTHPDLTRLDFKATLQSDKVST